MKRRRPVLVLEEDAQIRELLERWLGEAGHTVSWADDQPCLVVANVPHPRRAQPFIERLRAVYAAPIIVLSARFRRGLASSAEAARRLGVETVLPKPFTREELLAAVAASIREEQ
ncbi:MAG TPA: hypothetical protein VFJ95_11165 [Gammaproteobacteria bacterium]|nr:hypothetical protein [Gammaproteobacteria bacterium]